jgi:hypothetical protein
MIRKLFLVNVLAMPACLLAPALWAQNPAAAPGQGTQGGTIVPPSTNIYVVAGGVYGTGVYLGQPTTTASELTTGISLAGHAGISFTQPVEASAPGTFAPATTASVAPATTTSVAPATTTSVSGYTVYPASATTTAEPSGRLINDVGPSYFADSPANASTASPLSLGEVAAQYKANRSQNTRSYSNTDVGQPANKVTIVGGSQPAPGARSQIAQSHPIPSAPPQAQEQELTAKANPPSVSPESEPAEAAAGRLPDTSTLLPLLGLLGLVSSGSGLLLRKFWR